MPPIYEYECERCRIIFEELSKMDQTVTECELCHKVAKKIMSVSHGYVKGTDNPCKQ